MFPGLYRITIIQQYLYKERSIENPKGLFCSPQSQPFSCKWNNMFSAYLAFLPVSVPPLNLQNFTRLNGNQPPQTGRCLQMKRLTTIPAAEGRRVWVGRRVNRTRCRRTEGHFVGPVKQDGGALFSCSTCFTFSLRTGTKAALRTGLLIQEYPTWS